MRSAPSARATQKNKPIDGMVVLWDLKQTDGVWGGGKGFKPSTGDSFKVKSVKLIDGGKKLEITGCKWPCSAARPTGRA